MTTISYQRRPAISGLSIAAFFPFRRIKIASQQVSAEATEAHVQAEPDMRFHPICNGCGKKASSVHSWVKRTVRDLSMGSASSPNSGARDHR